MCKAMSQGHLQLLNCLLRQLPTRKPCILSSSSHQQQPCKHLQLFLLCKCQSGPPGPLTYWSGKTKRCHPWSWLRALSFHLSACRKIFCSAADTEQAAYSIAAKQLLQLPTRRSKAENMLLSIMKISDVGILDLHLTDCHTTGDNKSGSMTIRA